MTDLIHHPAGHVEPVEDWYDYFFADVGEDGGHPGDWIWSRVEIDGVTHRCMLIIFPLVGREPLKRSRIGQRGGELVEIFPSHQPNPTGWARPGPVNGWDGNEDEPTLHPSIFVRGNTATPGWHGFMQRGNLVNLDGTIVGV